jgi:hypothetical protein
MKIVKTFTREDGVYEMSIDRLMHPGEVCTKFSSVIKLSFSLKDLPPEMLFSLNLTRRQAIDICDAIMFMVK